MPGDLVPGVDIYRSDAQVIKNATPEEQELWDKLVVAVASANDCKTPETAVRWATVIVAARREAFKK